MDKKTFYILAERYFDADTSIQEEHALLEEALSLEGKDALADEILAVMGSARSFAPAIGSMPEKTDGYGRLIRRISGTAAAVVAALAIGLTFVNQEPAISASSECYAYVDGKKLESNSDINALINLQLDEMADVSQSVGDVISEDLDDMREALKFELL